MLFERGVGAITIRLRPRRLASYIALSARWSNAAGLSWPSHVANPTETERLMEERFDLYENTVPIREDLGVDDADKACDAIHFTLDPARQAGSIAPSTPGGRAVRGTHTTVPPSHDRPDLGWTWAGYSRPHEVEEIAAALLALDFGAAYDAAQAALDAASDSGDLSPRSDASYAKVWYGHIRELYREAAHRGQAVVVFHN